MANTQKLDTHHKALTLNLDPSTFGSFAEIGAGQEVARWFLTVGGASGTVAKTISAYDKEVSDDLYGSGSRYVSKQRLEAMLDKEWTELQTQLGKTHGPQTRFFSFADTVEVRNYAGTNDPHGWIGLRFQMQLGGPPNDFVLHINLRDPTNVLQQNAIGILATRGKLIVVGAPQDPIPLNSSALIFGGRSVHGSLTGTPIDSEDTLAFTVLENIRPMIETALLEQAADAYARMIQGKARFRMVLVTH